jgi:hypothetical protein
MHHTLCGSCTAFILVSYSPRIVIDHVEQGREELSESAPVEDSEPDKDESKLRCILPHPLTFIYFLSYFMIHDCALGHRSCIEALVS